MKRRVVFGVVLLAVAGVHAAKQPNVLWILTDDHRYDSICAFNKMMTGQEMSPLGYVESPQTDRLAEMGTTFINTYCQAQGCAPSRASMHMGRYPFRSGVYQFEYFNNSTENSYPLLPEEMADLGYQTMHVGKLGVRMRTLKDGKVANYPIYQTDVNFKPIADETLPEWGKVPLLKEIDGVKLKKPLRNVVYLNDADGTVYYISEELEQQNPQFLGMAQDAYDRYNLILKHSSKKNQPETVYNSGILAGVSPQPAGKTRDGIYTSAFVDYLKNANGSFHVGSSEYDGIDSEQPVFAHIGYDFPHTPVLPPEDFRKRFHEHTYKVPTLTDEEFNLMAKAFQKRVMTNYSDDFPEEYKQRMVRDYFAFCAYGDMLVGQAAEAFVEYSKQHKQPWMIVYVCGDHGWKLNEHGAIAKNTPWEIDSHTPVIVVSSDKKKFPAGKVVTELTELVDIAPTVLSAAGADIEADKFDHLDGMDLAKVVSGEVKPRDYVLSESHHAIGPRAFIRTKDYVFSVKTRPNSKRGEKMDWALSASWKDLDPSLYHTPSDPDEKVNLANNPEYQEIAMKMKDKLLNIVLGDNRAETNWGGDNFGKNTQAIGTDVHRSNFAPGADDKKLAL